MNRIASRIAERLAFSLAMGLVGAATLFGVAIMFLVRPAEHRARTWLRRLTKR